MSQILGFALIGLGLTVLVLYQGFRRIPASDPPQVALVTLFGKRINRIKKEGWRFFFGYPLIFGYIPISIEKINVDLEPQEVMTPDNARVFIPVSYTFTPDSRSGDALIEFINSGKKEGVINILNDIVKEELRQWARSDTEGPSNWQEAVGSQDEATALLFEAILGSETGVVPPSKIPTSVLLKYFAVPRKKPNEIETKLYGKNWEEVEKYLESIPERERKEIEGRIERLEKEAAKVREGNGDFKKKSLGITIHRLNVGEIKPSQEITEAAEKEAKEKREQAAERVELEHVSQRIEALQKLGLSNEQAIELIQTERDKVKKTIEEKKWNISPETRGMIEKILCAPQAYKTVEKIGAIAATLLGRKPRKKRKKKGGGRV